MGASNYVLQREHYTSSATRLQAFNRKNFTPILRIPIIGFFPPSILLENSIPASRSGVVKSTGGMMELQPSDDVTMGESNRNTADVGLSCVSVQTLLPSCDSGGGSVFDLNVNAAAIQISFYSLTLNSI